MKSVIICILIQALALLPASARRWVPKIAAAGGGPPFSENFTATDGNLAGAWTNILNTVQISSNAATGQASTNCAAVYSTSMGTTDHVSRCTLSTLGANGDNIGPAARCSNSTADFYAYYAFGTASARKLYRVNSGSFTLLATSFLTTVQGKVLALEVSGTGATVTLKCYYDGVLDPDINGGAAYSDSSASRLTTGNYAGISVFSNTNKLDDWSAAAGAGP